MNTINFTYNGRPYYRGWMWDGSHPSELDAATVESLIPFRTRGDSRGDHVEGEPNITITEYGKEPGGQCPGCPRCKCS